MRRAFVMGSNGPPNYSPLQYALSDADLVRKTLSSPRCGFEVISPEEGTSSWQTRLLLHQTAEACTVDDTFICYFSGHGILDKGFLYLLWDNTELDKLLTTALPISDVMQALRYCKSQSRLLILDCCHAGAIVNMLGLKNAAEIPIDEMEIRPDNHLVLMASGRLERARELRELEGSFLTISLCDALGDEFEKADKDKDGQLSINDLKRWLDERAIQHNRTNPDRPVPIPYLFGQQKGDFFFTLGQADWIPHEIPWIDGSIMVVLPVRLEETVALCMSKYPVTNAQYKTFVEETGYREPQGEHYIDNRWQGPFFPWKEKDFGEDNQPVGCVSAADAMAYCDWVNRKIELLGGKEVNGIVPINELERLGNWGGHPITDVQVTLPTPLEWDFAAFGEPFPNRAPHTWLHQTDEIHHRAAKPAPIDNTSKRANRRGISDMIGNVWEWCNPEMRESFLWKTSWLVRNEHIASQFVQLRGGGFLDNLTRVEPFLDASRLADKVNTKHTDLGFRPVARVLIRELPELVQARLAIRRMMPLHSELAVFDKYGW